MNPTEPGPPHPPIPGHPDGVPIKQQPPPPAPEGSAGGGEAGGETAATVALEGAGCCLDGCASCSIAVLVALFTAGAAVAAWLG